MNLLTIAIAPILFLIAFIYQKDVINKEPKSELAKVFFGGAVFSVIATLIFGDQIIPWLWGEAEDWDNSFLSVFGQAFIEAAIPEEFFKFVVLLCFVWKNKHFDENFDGIVYAVFVSMGFACTENLLYVVGGGIITGYFRAITAVPGHFLFAVIMGYYFSLAKFNPSMAKPNLCKSLAYAILAHGIYDSILMAMDEFEIEHPLAIIAFYIVFIIFLVKLWKIGLRNIDELREKDILTLPKDHPQRILYEKRQKRLNKKKKGAKQASASVPKFDPWAEDKISMINTQTPEIVSQKIQLSAPSSLPPQPQISSSERTMSLAAPSSVKTQPIEIPEDFIPTAPNFPPINDPTFKEINPASDNNFAIDPTFKEINPVSSNAPAIDPTFKEINPVSSNAPAIDPTFKEITPVSGNSAPHQGNNANPNTSPADPNQPPQNAPLQQTLALIEAFK